VTKVDTGFSGSIPSLYDKYLGPLIFEPYAEDLATRLSALDPNAYWRRPPVPASSRGALDRSLSPRAGIVATDLNQPMLDHAAERISSSRVGWQKADAQALPFPDATFDAVVCQFGVMFFPDKQKAYGEARRVLKPGGRFIFSVWDKLEHNEFPDLVSSAVADMFADDSRAFWPERRTAITIETRSSPNCEAPVFGNVAAETLTRRSVAPSCRDPAIGFCQGSPLRSEIEARDASRLAEATDAAAGKIAARFGNGPVDGKIQAHVFTASD